MVTMAEPWRHPETGMYYLRRQIPKPLRGEFGGKQPWKRSIETKEAAEARRAFTTFNAAFERLFAAARDAIAARAASTTLTPALAADAAARISAAYAGGRLDRLPVLANVFFTEEAASTLLGGVSISTFLDPSTAGFADMDAKLLPGDVWMRIIKSRTRAEGLCMAERMILWVHGEFRGGGERFGDLVRSAKNYLLKGAIATSRSPPGWRNTMGVLTPR